MSRSLHRLSARAVETLTKRGRHSDGGGLYLSIGPRGRRWVFIYVRDGKRSELGLGSAAKGLGVTLADARARAAELRSQLAAGTDPRRGRGKAAAPVTFGAFADQYVKNHKARWRSPKSIHQWEKTISQECAALRALPVADIGVDEVLGILQPMWLRVPETAARARGRIENLLDAAKAANLRSGENPARWRGHLQLLLPRQQKLTPTHHAAMPFAELPTFFGELMKQQGAAAKALRLTILTACRTSEMLGARWSEFDLDGADWTIPAERMKAGRIHRVPLSPAALTVIAELKAEHEQWQKEPTDFLFPSPMTLPKAQAKPMSNMAMAAVLKRMKREDVTVHGFRSTFRDWAAEKTSFPAEVAEMALAHTVGSEVERAYRRGDLFDKRRKLMEAWADYSVAGGQSKVIKLRR